MKGNFFPPTLTLILILVCFEAFPPLSAGSLAQAAPVHSGDHGAVAVSRAFQRAEYGSEQTSRLRHDTSYDFQLFDTAIKLVEDHYVEQISREDLFNIAMGKLSLIALPHCLEPGESTLDSDQDPEQCFKRTIRSISIRCKMDANRLSISALNVLLQGLDPNSYLLDPAMLKELKIGTSGKYGGVGMVVNPTKEGEYEVVSPFEGSPAYSAGIRPGDIIVEIDGQTLQGLPLLEVLRKVRGAPGSIMSVKVRHGRSGEVRKARLRRRTVEIPPVRYGMLASGLGYLRLVNFQHTAATAVENALIQMVRLSHGKMTGLILDLRDNPGGLFEEAIHIADFFVSSGVITSLRSRNGQLSREFRANGTRIFPEAPIAVLVNKGTASASEILAGSLQGRADVLVMGEQSFGKASVQAVFPLRKGMALRLTTAHYYTADGRDIDGKGLQPDVLVQEATDDPATHGLDLLTVKQIEQDPWVKKALEFLLSQRSHVRSPFSSWY